MDFNKRSLTPLEADIVLAMVEQKLSTIDAPTARRWIGRGTKSVSKLLASLQDKGWLERLGRGTFALIPPERGPEALGDSNPLALAWASVSPAYIGWWNAAAFHHFTTQHPVQITVATTRVHRRRIISDEEVRYVTLTPQKFFGFADGVLYGRPLQVSDREKTVIDCLDRPSLCGGYTELSRIMWRAAQELDWDRLLSYARKFGSTVVVQRLGFFLELIEAEAPESLLTSLEKMIGPNHRSSLGKPSAQAQEDAIGFVRRWGLLVPFSHEMLLAEVPTKSQASEQR